MLAHKVFHQHQLLVFLKAQLLTIRGLSGVYYLQLDQSDNRTAIEANIGEVYSIDLPSGVDPGFDQVDGFVETWYDQSGNGRDATQATAGSQPKIVDGGALVSMRWHCQHSFDGSIYTATGFAYHPLEIFLPLQFLKYLLVNYDTRDGASDGFFIIKEVLILNTDTMEMGLLM